MRADAAELLVDLDAQLAGGTEDEGLDRPAVGIGALDDGNAEGGGLAAAGVCLADQVATGEGEGDRSRLDRCGDDESHVADGGAHGVAEREYVEGNGRFGFRRDLVDGRRAGRTRSRDGRPHRPQSGT